MSALVLLLLPQEIEVLVFSRLPLTSAAAMVRTCKAWQPLGMVLPNLQVFLDQLVRAGLRFHWRLPCQACVVANVALSVLTVYRRRSFVLGYGALPPAFLRQMPMRHLMRAQVWWFSTGRSVATMWGPSMALPPAVDTVATCLCVAIWQCPSHMCMCMACMEVIDAWELLTQ